MDRSATCIASIVGCPEGREGVRPVMQLSVRLVPVGDTTLVIALTGELDSTTRPVLAAFLDPLPQSPVKYVIVAAGDLWFCDLNGLEQLAITHSAMLAKGGHLAVAEARPTLCRLIALMSDQRRPGIPVFTNMPEALAGTDVEVYETAGPPRPQHRHLPRFRKTRDFRPEGAHGHVRTHPKAEEAQKRSRTPPSDVDLPPIIYQSQALREEVARQQHALVLRRTMANEARLRLLDTRARCDASLRALRASLDDLRSAVRPTPSSPRGRPSISA
jgi:anti-anti-sigma regulatory factor